MKVYLLAAASIIPLSIAQAHTISVGYSLDGPGAVTFWYGTYHDPSEANHTEGSFHLFGQDVTYDQTVAFDKLVYVKPTGLIDGTTNFYSDGTQLVGTNTDPGGPADAWQGVSFTHLLAGTYDFTYVPIAIPTDTWAPRNSVILSNHVTLTAQDLGGSPPPEAPPVIDGSQGSFNQNDSAATASHVVFNGGVFAPTNTTMMGQGVTLESAGGVIDSTNGDVVLTGAVDGAGGLTKLGAGVLVLAGANTYAGGTTIQGGTLMGDSTSLQGKIVDNATLVFDQSADGAFNGGVSGSGMLVKTGAANLVLSGTNTYSGGTIIQEGSLTVDSGSLQGPVTNNASLVFNQTTDGAFSGAIDGSGVLIKQGVGELALTGVNTSTGGTQIEDGTLSLGSQQALGAGQVVATGGTLKFDYTGTLAQNVAIAQGALVIDTQANTVVASGAYTGAGSLTKIGSGDLTLNGDSSLTGATTVQAGQLIVNGSLAGSVATVEQGAVIGGVGTLGGLIVRTAATAAPGDATPVTSGDRAAPKTGSAAAQADGFSSRSRAANAAPTGSIGKLTVGTFVVFERGSTYALDVDAGGANDRIDVTGTATLEGGTVQVQAANGNYKPVTSYTIINAAGGVTGKFENVVSDLAFLSPELSYTANAVNLTLVRNDVRFSDVAVTRNQRAVGAVVDKQFGFGTGVYDSLVRGTEEDARLAFDQMSGEIHAVVQATAIADGDTVREALIDHLAAPVEAEEGRMPTVWGTAFGAWGDVRSDGNASSADRAMGGFLMGVEAAPAPGVRLGVAGGYSDTDAEIHANQSSSDIRTGHVWAYGSAERGPWALSGGVGYADLAIHSKRAVDLRDLSDHLSSKSDGSLTQAFVEVSYHAEVRGVELEPMAGLTAYRLKTDSFQEAGGVTALAVQGVDHDLSASTLGVRASRDFGHDKAFSAHMTVAWRHSLHDMDPAAVVAFRSGGQAFSVAAAPLDKDAAEVDAGVDWRITEKLSAGATYQGAVGKLEEDQAVKARLSYRF